MYKIVLTGPESTGKTTLAQQLATHYKTHWVEEYARIYIDALDRPYVEKDLLEIAKGQIQNEEKSRLKAQNFLFIDTDLITIKIWAEYRYKHCDEWILQQIQERHYDLYLLCATDIAWEYDPQRENPHDREKLFQLYIKELEFYKKHFWVVEGDKMSRLKQVVTYLNQNFIVTNP